jgi:HPt (histidine-containing phosphotransfer) domain-containing protein
MNDTTVLDYEEFLNRVGGEDDFAWELLAEFVGGLSGDIDGLKGALRTGDLEEIVLRAHTLKGSAANLSAKALSEAAKVIECAGLEKDLETAQVGMPKVEEEAEKLKDRFAAMKPA